MLSTLKTFWDQTKTETGINVRSYRNQKNKPPNAKTFLLQAVLKKRLSLKVIERNALTCLSRKENKREKKIRAGSVSSQGGFSG